MFFYFFILLILFFFSTQKYNTVSLIIPTLIVVLMIVLKGQVGCDYTGYLHRYIYFDAERSFMLSKGEVGWYLIEYFTNVNNWGYYMYTVFTGLIGGFFLIKAQKNIKYIGFLAFIFQMILVQLGLSGMRQFIAVCILTYAVSTYIFGDQKSYVKFILLLILGATFHISVLAMGFLLPFLFKLKKRHIFLLGLFCLASLSLDVLSQSVDKYDTRYLEGTSVSSGAWIRFLITVFIIVLGLRKENKKLYNLGIAIIIFGLILGVVNSIALHRFNYYFLPIACMPLIYNYKKGLIKKRKMNYVYGVSLFYFLFWFTFSKYSSCFIPYNTFLNSF